MTFYDVLTVCGRYTDLIQVGYKSKKSGVMKVGNINYKQIDHYCYGKRVLSLTPFSKNGKDILFIHLIDD